MSRCSALIISLKKRKPQYPAPVMSGKSHLLDAGGALYYAENSDAWFTTQALWYIPVTSPFHSDKCSCSSLNTLSSSLCSPFGDFIVVEQMDAVARQGLEQEK